VTLRRTRRFRIRRPQVAIGVGIVAVICLAAFLAPLIAPYTPNAVNPAAALVPPSAAHLMGTDFVGRDVFSRVLYGARQDIIVVVLITYIGLVIGVLVGSVAGYFGGWFDAIVGRIADTAIAFPFIVLVLAIIAIVGPGIKGVAIGIIAVGWALYARLSRSEMLSLKEQSFMLATKALGYSHARSILRHALPNLIRSSLVYSTIDVVVNLLVLAGLSYLGVGVQEPGADLGTIISNGQPYLLTAWWIATMPGIVLVLFGIGVSLIGEGLTEGELVMSAL
jgi:peptide/nickel transport system permease protein